MWYRSKNISNSCSILFGYEKKVDQISCGIKHSENKLNNKIYTLGCNSNGQLGSGNLKYIYVPTLNDIKYSKVKTNFLQVSWDLDLLYY